MKPETIIREEYSTFIEWAKSGFDGHPKLSDPTHSRLLDVVSCLNNQCRLGVGHIHANPIEFAVLLRQIVRRFKEGLNLDVVVKLPHGVDDQLLAKVGMTALPVSGGYQGLTASPWRPRWLEATSETTAVDASSLSPLDQNARARFLLEESQIEADPIFSEATGNSYYRSPGQLAATRSALSIAPGSTLIAQLPTGGGKTDVAIAVLKSEILENSRTNVLIVPTVALAMDLERRFRNIIGNVWGFEDEVRDMPLVWTGETRLEVRDEIKTNIATGVQPILITSPETLALDNGVGAALEIAAANGQVGWLIVDEAHIIKQWGQDFRPDFLDVAPLRNKLKRCAEGNGFEPLRTLLLSATYTSDTLEYLVEKFEDNSPIHLSAANELRAEIDIWTDVSNSKEERQEKFLEAIYHLPRPLIVYATKPDHAKYWVEWLQSKGFSRTSAFSGKTVGKDRREILQKFRNDLGDASEYDIVIATSAFGLGVDYDQVRAVVHVCLPETVDRWYQEIGRGGRDGYQSVAVTLSCESDLSDAQGLGVSVLNSETAWKRYQNILSNLGIGAKDDPSLRYFNLHETPDAVEQGSYNRRWNKQTLRGLIDLGIFEQKITWWRDIPPEDRERLDQIHDDDEIRAEILRLRILQNLLATDFNRIWDEWKARELGSQDVSLTNFLESLRRKNSICNMLASTYESSQEISTNFKMSSWGLFVSSPCGQCPDCRVRHRVRDHLQIPNPINMIEGYKRPATISRVQSLVSASSGRIRLVVDCGNGQVAECINLISSKMPIHVIGSCKKSNVLNDSVLFFDDDFSNLLATPSSALVIERSESLNNQEVSLLMQKVSLFHDSPIFIVGENIETPLHFYKIDFLTLQHWIEENN
jgi:superfamily II DNA/RNA helicase